MTSVIRTDGRRPMPLAKVETWATISVMQIRSNLAKAWRFIGHIGTLAWLWSLGGGALTSVVLKMATRLSLPWVIVLAVGAGCFILAGILTYRRSRHRAPTSAEGPPPRSIHDDLHGGRGPLFTRPGKERFGKHDGSRYPRDFAEPDFVELRQIASEVGQDGSFDANDFLFAYIQHRTAAQGGTTEGYNARPVNAGSVAQILQDLSDLDVVRPVDGNPPRWELAG